MNAPAAHSRVLVVDSQATATRLLAAVLANHGYTVRSAADGQTGFAQFAAWRPALVLTDLLLPVMGGLELCRRIRALSRVPIIVVSERNEQAVKVEALDFGADDYVTKPFGTGELLARIRATLRRTDGEGAVESFEAGVFRVDMDTHRVHVHETTVRLTPKEFDLFVYMARRPNRVLDHRKLLAAVWGETSIDQTEYLRVFMGQLRKKLEPMPSQPRYLLTEPWVGYVFRPQQ
jgi:two-component system KDP operon response regulator KdpE